MIVASAPTGRAGSYWQETSRQGVAAVSRPPCIEPKARRRRNFGLETEATFANEVSGQWSPSGAAPFEKETSREKPEAVARGWQ